MAKFPLVLAAVQKAAEHVRKSQWAIGDALVTEIGPPRNGAHDKRLEQCSKELAAEGFEYSEKYLSHLRQVSASFSPARRRADISWEVHREAGDPDRLETLIKAARGKPLSRAYARKLIDAARDAERRRRQAAAEKASEERARAKRKREEAEIQERQATSAAEKKKHKTEKDQAAEQEAAAHAEEQKNKTAPKRKDVAPPSPEQVALLLVQQQFGVDVGTIIKLTAKMKEDITPRLPELGAIFINSAVEDLLKAADQLRELSNLLRQHRTNKRGHIHEVA